MKAVTLIIGTIRFYEEDETTDKHAVIDEIKGIINFHKPEHAQAMGEQLIGRGVADSYIIGGVYDGDIKFTSDFDTEIIRMREDIVLYDI